MVTTWQLLKYKAEELKLRKRLDNGIALVDRAIANPTDERSRAAIEGYRDSVQAMIRFYESLPDGVFPSAVQEKVLTAMRQQYEETTAVLHRSALAREAAPENQEQSSGDVGPMRGTESAAE